MPEEIKPTQLVKSYDPKTGRIELTEAGKKAITTKATSLGTGIYVPRNKETPCQ